ncbi:MAG: DNA-formamidopyrimidine glycosylase [Snowella sp.]|nr:DNA-formamidopyrimidine glycosylase [Snowella sp.]
MPELPEVETVCRGLNRLASNQVIKGGEVLLHRTLAYPFSVEDFWQQLQGVKIQVWQRRGKYLFAKLENATGQSAGFLGVHLRMTGQLLWVNATEPRSPHTRIVFACENGKELRFVDIRTFGKIWAIPPNVKPEAIMTGLQNLGPEPFASEFTVEYLQQKLAKSQRSLKTALLDQRVVAGLGNIYADEVLFKSGIHPTTLGSQLTSTQVEKLHAMIIEVLKTAIASGGTTFSDFRDVTGLNGNYGGVAWVYGRRNEPCRVCGTQIERIKLVGRSSHFCPQCQR